MSRQEAITLLEDAPYRFCGREVHLDVDKYRKALARLRAEEPKCKTCKAKPVLPPVTGERKQGHSKLVYDKKLKTIVSVDPHPKEPEAGEFTKRVRTEPYNPKWKHTVIIRTEDRDKLCDIIDRQSAELKKLLKEKE